MHCKKEQAKSSNPNQKNLFRSMILIGIFMIVEAIGGFVSNSLALLSDASHMFSDFLALLLSWLATGYSDKPANRNHSFGYHRIQVIVAFINSLMLFFISLMIFSEAIIRINHPAEVDPKIMLPIAAIGFIVNVLVLSLLKSGGKNNININVKSAILHILGDLLGFAAAIIAAIIIMYTNFTLIDPILSMFIACLILHSAYIITRDSGYILMEGAPKHINTKTMRDSLLNNIPQLLDVHDIHLWSLSENYIIVTLHAVIKPAADNYQVLFLAKKMLKDTFAISHSTIELEYETGKCIDEALGIETITK